MSPMRESRMLNSIRRISRKGYVYSTLEQVNIQVGHRKWLIKLSIHDTIKHIFEGM